MLSVDDNYRYIMLALLLISSLHIGSLVCQKGDGGVECDVEDEEEDEDG